MERAPYHAPIGVFLADDEDRILGQLAGGHRHDLDPLQRNAWVAEITHLKWTLQREAAGYILLEYAIPRMGKRVDAVILLRGVVYVVEYKVGADTFRRHDIDQVMDYALDLKNFHAGSHDLPIIPVLVATEAPPADSDANWYRDQVARPILANAETLSAVLRAIGSGDRPDIDPAAWLAAAYKPTPTIIEAAKALYEGHSVADISRSEAGATNLSKTAATVSALIEKAKKDRRKTICFVTGVPGSGKTLAGLNLATRRMRAHADEHAVFLSGNGPLVTVLREALARDEVARARTEGRVCSKGEAAQKAHAFIQNIHHFRDEALRSAGAPVEKVVVFDEAQRAWDREQTNRFMREKRQQTSFDHSEPEFLLSVMDRQDDWCVVVCLVGGGQEINTGEAGMHEWLHALATHFPHWRVAYSERLLGAGHVSPEVLETHVAVFETSVETALHLATNIRSFRAETVSDFVAAVLEGSAETALAEHAALGAYPIVLTRDLQRARDWLRSQARGTERIGLVASANALRLRAEGLYVKSKINPVHWFLNDRDDVRSSFSLEETATEFDIQGLELDWVGVCWDANMRHDGEAWRLYVFKGTKWQAVRQEERSSYLVNAYRVLLTRARQGMVIFVPEGNPNDATRQRAFYDGTFRYLRRCGLEELK